MTWKDDKVLHRLMVRLTLILMKDLTKKQMKSLMRSLKPKKELNQKKRENLRKNLTKKKEKKRKRVSTNMTGETGFKKRLRMTQMGSKKLKMLLTIPFTMVWLRDS